MKVNHRELSSLLQGNGKISGWFYLSVYDFAAERRASDCEQYVRRWCLLENNVLLTSKHERGNLESVLLLEDYSAELCQSRMHGYGLKLKFPNSGETESNTMIHNNKNSEYHMYCSSKELAEKWLEAINDCGYMSLHRRWKALQEEYSSILAQQNRISKCFIGPEESLLPNEASREVVVWCELPLNSPTQNTFASVYTQNGDGRWFLCYQTENADHTLNPHYTKTFHFELDNVQMRMETPLKFCINNMTTCTVLGYVICSLSDIQSARDSRFTAPLRDDNGNEQVGVITLELSVSSQLPTAHPSLLQMISSTSLLSLNAHRGFAFKTNHGKIHVTEQMWDVRATFSMPLAYINFLLRKKERVLGTYEEFTSLDPVYDAVIAQMITHHETSLLNLIRAKQFLLQYEGPMYRKSVQRKESEWQYCPVNLAVYAVGVCDERAETNYFTTTTGAFTAHGLGYKFSLQTSLVTAQKNSLHTVRHDRLTETIDQLYELWEDIELSKQILIDAIALEQSELYDTAVSLITKISDLTEFCKRSDLMMGVQLLSQAEAINYNSVRERNWSTPEADYVWDGERYREKARSRSSSVDLSEKREMETAITLAITTFIQAVEKKSNTVARDMLKLLASLEPLVTQARQALMFMLLLEENKIFNSFFSCNPDIEMRTNQCFSQGLSCLYSTFHIALLDAAARNDHAYFRILEEIGFLVQFQSLLSTYSQELAMLEDHWITINSLSHCSFVLTQDPIGTIVNLSGLAQKITITMGAGSEVWELLPEGLRQGKAISVNTVLFSKGINEQQILAEKVGCVDLQETINLDGLCKLEVYHMMFREYCARADPPLAADFPRLDVLFPTISQHVRSKISKDVQLLTLVDEAVRLMFGSRVTSCKSAKDRTAMSVTYEAVCSLSRNHALVSGGVQNALSALRSHGVRPLNCKKNTGSSKYAFNGFQIKILPKEYTPPIGSYGGKIT